MSGTIYFFIMGLTLFVLPQIAVKLILNYKKQDKQEISTVKFGSDIFLLVLAFTLPLIWIFVPMDLKELREVNFLQHMIGGGVSVGLVAAYFVNSLKYKFPMLGNFVFQGIFFYSLVCMSGVLNELLEFFLDFLKIGIFSSDRYDTWFDLVANTLGAASVFFLYSLFNILKLIINKFTNNSVNKN